MGCSTYPQEFPRGFPRGCVAGFPRGPLRTIRTFKCYSITANSYGHSGGAESGSKMRKDMKNRVSVCLVMALFGAGASSVLAGPTLLPLRAEAGTCIYGGS